METNNEKLLRVFKETDAIQMDIGRGVYTRLNPFEKNDLALGILPNGFPVLIIRPNRKSTLKFIWGHTPIVYIIEHILKTDALPALMLLEASIIRHSPPYSLVNEYGFGQFENIINKTPCLQELTDVITKMTPEAIKLRETYISQIFMDYQVATYQSTIFEGLDNEYAIDILSDVYGVDCVFPIGLIKLTLPYLIMNDIHIVKNGRIHTFLKEFENLWPYRPYGDENILSIRLL